MKILSMPKGAPAISQVFGTFSNVNQNSTLEYEGTTYTFNYVQTPPQTIDGYVEVPGIMYMTYKGSNVWRFNVSYDMNYTSSLGQTGTINVGTPVDITIGIGSITFTPV